MKRLSKRENKRIDQEAQNYEQEQEYFVFLEQQKNTKNPEKQTQFDIFLNGFSFN